jgi:hypothetical protein
MTSSGLSVISDNFELGVGLSVNYPGIPRHPPAQGVALAPARSAAPQARPLTVILAR